MAFVNYRPQLAGVPATSDSPAQSVHQPKYTAPEELAGTNEVPVIRNPLAGLASYPGKFRDLHQIGEFHCHSFFSELRPLPVVLQ